MPGQQIAGFPSNMWGIFKTAQEIRSGAAKEHATALH